MDYVEIVRFSNTGFVPQLQTFYLKHLKHLATGKWKHDKELFKRFPFMFRELAEQQKDINYNFAKGVWVFKKGQENWQQLNHLPKWLRRSIKCWEAKIPKDTIVFDGCDKPFLKRYQTTAEKAWYYMFIPEESIRFIYDIVEIENKFAKKSGNLK
jgi:hypothetical protein